MSTAQNLQSIDPRRSHLAGTAAAHQWPEHETIGEVISYLQAAVSELGVALHLRVSTPICCVASARKQSWWRTGRSRTYLAEARTPADYRASAGRRLCRNCRGSRCLSLALPTKSCRMPSTSAGRSW